MFPPGRAILVTMPKGTGSAMVATTGIVSVAALKLKTSLDAAVTMISGFVRTTSWQSSGKRSSRPSARVSRDDQINSLDVAQVAQFLEKRWKVRIAPGFAHVSGGNRGVNEGNAVCLRSLLCVRCERP
jgi:hypothetical protein